MRTPLSGLDTPNVVRGSDLTATNGTYALTLQPGRVYTVTTTSGQAPGTATSPRRSQLALPYSDSFAGYSAGREARYFATMNGAFESASCADGRSGQCLRQMAEVQPIKWTHENSTQPYTIMGELGWSNYTVSSDVLLEKSGSAAEILGRVVGLDHPGRRHRARPRNELLAQQLQRRPGRPRHRRVLPRPVIQPVHHSRNRPRPLRHLQDHQHQERQGPRRLHRRHANGTPIIQWTDNGGTNQQWRLVKIA
ncbi:hypothetical protein [Streptomyces sp. NPDC006140]|uniref:hypothetical protein n=1 Tax=Streptomyces sp. NPDC006140 TaxID=3154579 RepID=UPI0033F41C4B